MDIRFLIIFLSIASQYGPGTMEMVVENRQNGNAWVSLPVETPDVDGFIAVQDCENLGDTWYIQNPINGKWESFWIVDCARPGDGSAAWMEENNIAMEVDYQSAVRWNTVGRGIKVKWAKENPYDYLSSIGKVKE